VLIFDRGSTGKIRIAAADAGTEVDGDDAAAAGHRNAGHRRSSTGSAASAAGAGSGRDASLRGGVGAMAGSGLASARACSIYRAIYCATYCATRARAGYQTGSAARSTDPRFVATRGRHGQRTCPRVRR